MMFLIWCRVSKKPDIGYKEKIRAVASREGLHDGKECALLPTESRAPTH